MSSKIPNFETNHFLVPGEQIEQWDENKIPLPESAGAKFIAPRDLVARLKKPFYYDWEYETDGSTTECIELDQLVYAEEWVDEEKDILHFPHCKELFKINDYLKQYGWFIPISWELIVQSFRDQFANTQDFVSDESLSPTFRRLFNLELSGYVFPVNPHDLKPAESGENGYFWAISEDSPEFAKCLYLEKDFINPLASLWRARALSVRCVTN